MSSRDPIIVVRDLHVHFYTYAGIVRAVDGVSFTVYRGETFCLVGETGCGKSVTAKALARIVPPPGKIVKGEIIFYPEPGKPIDIMRLSEKELEKIRGRLIAYVFQDPSAALDPLYTVGYQLAETVKHHGIVKSFKEGFQIATKLFRKVLMPDADERVKAYPHELSGGMKQRSVIAISLSTEPKLLIADEPTTALDVTVQAQVMDVLKRLKKEKNLTLILITHNMGLVAEMCDRVAVMYAGRIVEEAPVDELFKQPLHPYTKMLLQAVPDPSKRVERLESIPGSVPSLANPPPGCRFHPRCPYALKRCSEEKPPEVYVNPSHRVACWLCTSRE